MKKITIKSNTRLQLESAIEEIIFANMQTRFLLNTLEELKTFTGELEKDVINNAIERYNLDKLIHAKIIFKK